MSRVTPLLLFMLFPLSCYLPALFFFFSDVSSDAFVIDHIAVTSSKEEKLSFAYRLGPMHYLWVSDHFVPKRLLYPPQSLRFKFRVTEVLLCPVVECELWPCTFWSSVIARLRAERSLRLGWKVCHREYKTDPLRSAAGSLWGLVLPSAQWEGQTGVNDTQRGL